MAEQTLLDVLGPQRLAQQRILTQIQHADAQIIAGAPVGVHLAQFVGRERLAGSDFVGSGSGAAGGAVRVSVSREPLSRRCTHIR